MANKNKKIKDEQPDIVKQPRRKDITWAQIIREIGAMDVSEIAPLLDDSTRLRSRVKKLPKGIQIKYLVVARAYGELALANNHGLWTSMMDRSEGRPTQAVDLSTKGKEIKLYVGLSPDDWDEVKDTKEKDTKE